MIGGIGGWRAAGSRGRSLLWALMLLLVPLTAGAQPPPWAPAHGYRAKQAPPLPDLGILRGTCNREALGGVIGGAIGAAVGARIGEGDTRLAATAAGALIGWLLGRAIGRSMDEADRYCAGQTLERAPDRHAVTWRNPDSGIQYQVTPIRTFETLGRYCREYTTEAAIGSRRDLVYGRACRTEDGDWEIMN